MSSFFKEVTDLELLYNPKSEDSLKFGVSALPGYLPNSLIYTIFYLLALPPNICLLYMGLRTDLITSRVKFPTLGMTLANLFGLVGFLTLNFVYLYAVITETRLSLFICSFVRTVLYNTSYVCYFLFPLLAVDQYLFICQNVELKISWLKRIVGICFAIPMAVAIYDLFLQDVILYDYMFKYIRMSLYTNMFFFLVLAPSFFAFSFICNILVLLSIIQRQSKTSRKQCGRSLNPRQLQQHKSIIYTYILQAFLPLALATPYYIAYLPPFCKLCQEIIKIFLQYILCRGGSEFRFSTVFPPDFRKNFYFCLLSQFRFTAFPTPLAVPTYLHIISWYTEKGDWYVRGLCLMYDVDIPLVWFIVGEGIISLHPLSNALITLILLRPYREAFKKLIRRGFKQKSHPNWPSKIQRLLSAPPEINTDTEGENNNKKLFYKTAIVTNKDGEEPFCATYNNVTAVSL
ncbi:unnamed protein product [Meloidogyne enterolobii]|uniref:Uncharacterized protein n=1 Tax=Meloidogyne enterolobii TaxID=390850 RepID=A0ACB0Y2P5_MELEN